jgi:peptide/nickel transport system substrate-binding protein
MVSSNRCVSRGGPLVCLAVVAVALSLVGCSDDNDAAENTEAAESTEAAGTTEAAESTEAVGSTEPAGSTEASEVSSSASGGELTVALGSGVTCIDPQQTSIHHALAIGRSVADSLVDQDPVTGEIVPWLVESWEINDDSTEFTLHVKDGVTFSDGSSFTAQVLSDNLDYIKNTLGARSPRGSSYLADYTGTTVIDDTTAVVNFAKPTSPFLVGMSTNTFAMLSESTMRRTPDERCTGSLIGTGPFVLEDFTLDQSARVTKREGYDWPSPVADHTGDAYLDAIAFQFAPVSNVRAGALASGQVDVASPIEPQDVAQLEAAGSEMLIGIMPGMGSTVIANPKTPGLDDPAVRQAILTSIDREAISERILGGYFPPATSFLTANLREHIDLPNVVFDPDAARQGLDDAGWVLGSDGIRSKDGQSLTMRLLYTTDTGAFYESVAQLIQAQLKEVGIGLTLESKPVAAFLETLAAGGYDLYIGHVNEADPDIIRALLLGFFADQDALNELGIYPLFEESRATTDLAARAEIFADIQTRLVDAGYLIPGFDFVQIAGGAENVSGLRMSFKAELSFYDTHFVE